MKSGIEGWPAGAAICLRLGALNDKKVVEATQSSFDVVVLQANLAVSARKSLSSWIALDKPFWIDPITYAFVANPTYLMSEQKVKRGESATRVDFKRTFRDLADAYGEPFTRLTAESRRLQPDDFDPSHDRDVVRTLIEWQRTVLDPSESDKRYLGDLATLEPALLTAPFFPLSRPDVRGQNPDWLDVNLRLAEAAAQEYPVARLAIGLLIEDSLFDDEAALTPVIDRYLALEARHLWIWISDNDEEAMTEQRARGLRDLVRRASEEGFTVHQAFGGTFSALLLAEGLTSVGYGVSYWEHKNWEPLAGGGLPSLRFFYPPLGQRLRFLDADAVNDSVIDDAQDFHVRVCGCETCLETLEGDLARFAQYGLVEVRARTDRRGHRIEYDVPMPDALRRTKEHYVRSRGLEARRYVGAGFDPRAHLLQSVADFGDQPVIDLRYLGNWRKALAE